MAFTLSIKTGNAAFCDPDAETENDPANEAAERAEVARILREVAKDLEEGSASGTCMDVNGNSVGKWSL